LFLDHMSRHPSSTLFPYTTLFRSPYLRYVREDRLGLNFARNTGAQTASAKYIAYIDDDAQAEPQWLEAILVGFETAKPQPACVRSEEHTSELQSRENLVCRLLLEK